MVRILVLNDRNNTRASTFSTWRDLDIVHVIADGQSHGTQIEGPLRANYLFIEVPGPAPTDLIGDTGGLLPADAVWRDLMLPEVVDELLGIDENLNPVIAKRHRQKRVIDFDSARVPQLNRIRNQGGDTFTVTQVLAFLRRRPETK